jgi:hypothetical protein
MYSPPTSPIRLIKTSVQCRVPRKRIVNASLAGDNRVQCRSGRIRRGGGPEERDAKSPLPSGAHRNRSEYRNESGSCAVVGTWNGVVPEPHWKVMPIGRVPRKRDEALGGPNR